MSHVLHYGTVPLTDIRNALHDAGMSVRMAA